MLVLCANIKIRDSLRSRIEPWQQRMADPCLMDLQSVILVVSFHFATLSESQLADVTSYWEHKS